MQLIWIRAFAAVDAVLLGVGQDPDKGLTTFLRNEIPGSHQC
jgi:hypothetical protein